MRSRAASAMLGLGLPACRRSSPTRSGPREPNSTMNGSQPPGKPWRRRDAEAASRSSSAGDTGVERRGQLGGAGTCRGQVPQARSWARPSRRRRCPTPASWAPWVADGLADGEQDAGRHARARRRDVWLSNSLRSIGWVRRARASSSASVSGGQGRAARHGTRSSSPSRPRTRATSRGHQPAEVGQDLVGPGRDARRAGVAVRRHVGVVAEEREVELFDGDRRVAHALHAHVGQVDVQVAAEEADRPRGGKWLNSSIEKLPMRTAGVTATSDRATTPSRSSTEHPAAMRLLRRLHVHQPGQRAHAGRAQPRRHRRAARPRLLRRPPRRAAVRGHTRATSAPTWSTRSWPTSAGS